MSPTLQLSSDSSAWVSRTFSSDSKQQSPRVKSKKRTFGIKRSTPALTNVFFLLLFLLLPDCVANLPLAESYFLLFSAMAVFLKGWVYWLYLAPPFVKKLYCKQPQSPCSLAVLMWSLNFTTTFSALLKTNICCSCKYIDLLAETKVFCLGSFIISPKTTF